MARYLATQRVQITGEGVYGPDDDMGPEFIRPDDERPLADWVVPLDEPAKAAFRKWDAEERAQGRKGKRMPSLPKPAPNGPTICARCSTTCGPAELFCSHCGANLAPQRAAREADDGQPTPAPATAPAESTRAADKAL